MAKGLTAVGVLVLLAAALHLPPPHLVLAADCPRQGELILEYMSGGGFTRTYRFVDCEGNEFYSSRYIALGDRAREWTTLQAKQALIEMGIGSAPDSTSQAEESGSSLLPYRDPTSAIALTEEREAEFDATEVTEVG